MIGKVPGMPRPMEMAALETYADSPFVDSIGLVSVSKGLTPPTMTLYDGTADPLVHVNQYKQKMMVVIATGSLKEACMCKGFGSTLSRVALQWFVSLPNKSISTFPDLVNTFNQQFASTHKPEKQTSDLYRVVQRFEESTRDNLNRFNIEKVSILKCDVPIAVEAFRRGLHHDSDLYSELTKYPCTTFEEVQKKAVTFMRLEEDESMRDVYDTERTNRKITIGKKVKDINRTTRTP
ncbi:uncharacterized protein LOC141631477 [Silene latifolia]|uniref:uncharacterized protein LOC141631477 n=1 Tax=Silene latifolia TaxID=37657 RepID=UPI003D7873F9